MCDLTPERAGQIIDEIRLLNGVISDEERASTPAGVLRALDALRQNCAETISRLDPISGRLLIYQLISKATCLEYDRAKARREDPFIKFTLSKDGLIIDSNDNGYSEEDIRELCKPYPEQRLVLLLHHELFAAFQIGSKVSIQSAPFSLSFQYAVGDNKMDKITPKREDLMVLPPKVSLRISITGFHPGRFDELRDALRDIIRDGMHGRPLFPDLTDETYLSIHGRPLFPDLKDETYLSILSTRYSPFLEFLKPLGVRQVSDLELLEQVKEFYRPLSCTFNPPQDNDWSSRVARLLTSWLEMKPDGVLATGVKELRLLLLSDGTKVRGVDCVPNEVWLSHDTNGNVVPAFPQVICRRDFKALDDASNRLYKSLGIHCPNHQEVMKRIDSQTHQLHDPSSSGYVLDMLLYIKTTATKIDKRQIHCLLMFDREFHKDLTPGANGLCRCQLQRDVYFPSNDPYSMSKIAERLNMISNIPAIHVLNEGLIHPTLLEERGIPSTEWVSWLENVALVRRVPRLQNRLDSTRLSDIFEAILKYCPTMFLGVLGTHWHEYKGGLEPEIISRIKETSVSTLSGDRMLRECYLSTRELRTIVIRILGSNLGSPFLLHQDAFSEKVRDKWGFLSIFGVLTDPTPAFFVELSKQLSQTVPLAKARSQFQELYDIISERNQDEIRTFFQETNVIYIPDENKSAKLVPLKSCVWDGPEWLQSSHRLRHIKEYFENRSIQFMLRTTLGIQDATLHTYIRELQHQQDLGLGWISQIERTYEHLAKMQMNEQDVTFVQDQFKQHKLVYNPKTSKWHTLEECIWAAPSDEDNIGITEYYPKLRELFVDRLLIEEPTVQSYVAKLERTAGKNTRTDQICSLIQRIINLSPSPSDLDPLSEVSFLPIEGMNQKHYYASPKDDFFIIDQDGWPSNFRGLVPTLRLTTKQIQEIRPFLDALALDNRFISVAGMKETLVLEEPKAGSQSLTFDFRDRAIPFCRCSVFYAGDKGKSPQELYDIFSTSVIYESLKIEARCTLRMSDGTNKSIGVPSKLHLQFENEELHIVVPSNGTQRKVCYATQLPAALAGLYASNSPVARGTFATILREPIEALDDILIDYGIPDLPELNIPDKLSIKTETGCTKTEVEDIFFTPSASLTSSLTNPSGLFSAVDSAPANLDILAVRLKNLLPPSGKDEERPA
ncbi:uncharacterized protein KD926_003471 [Aspergillus affinis]|uniref:uncharacterized protein n=1 Tax=Aspergillus affinis TaxID=1070780 RepID=UPI0022FF2514|nr:uncharacterized protein KD926_003471 [Aspergillus affinis]KAI9035475.1 hypothetical protein KD926_003471 [Aspergillus affinis]